MRDQVEIEPPAKKRERELEERIIGSLVYKRIKDGAIPPEWTPKPVPQDRLYSRERVVYESDRVTYSQGRLYG